MPLMVGVGNGRADRNVMCVLFPLAAVFLLSVGVVAVPEEHNAAVQEQPPQEVAHLHSLLLIKTFSIVGRKLLSTPVLPLLPSTAELATKC